MIMQFIKSAFIALALFSTIGGTTASTKRNTNIIDSLFINYVLKHSKKYVILILLT